MNVDAAFTKKLLVTSMLVILLLLSASVAGADNNLLQQAYIDHKVMPMHNITNDERMAAALDAAAKGLSPVRSAPADYRITAVVPVQGGTPDYFGPYSNYANSQLPFADGLGNVIPGTGIRKFVDSLPGLTSAGQNNLGQYIPVATSDTLSYPGDDYYVIALVQYSEKMHSDITPTLLRGYVQLETPNITGSAHIPLYYPNGSSIRNTTGGQVYAFDNPHYLGPVLVAQKDKPMRVKFINYLPTGTEGNLFIPVDTTQMGAGVGPDGINMYTENRATIHLHGGNTPWISDGTPHQWTTPAGENTPYPEGVSVKNVPDMDGGNEPFGTLTFYYTNQQSARLMFYHDHAYGITRLNVYAGEAAGFIIRDPAEQGLIVNGTIPGAANEIPLIIQDKTFVPNASQLAATDPTWNWGNTSTLWPHTGDLWYPHVYMPAQNYQLNYSVAPPMGRWDYGPWAFPPYNAFLNQPIANPYFTGPNGSMPWEPPLMPATPNPSTTPESFMDTSLVNGAAYPYVQLGPHAYRFRILNACNDRTLNLQIYYAASNASMWSGTTLLNGSAGEILTAPALPGQPGQPADWPTDGRDGGVPWANRSGPSWIQIGTEGGFLPAPVVIPPRPIGYDYQRETGGVLPIKEKSLLLMPAQRADVIVDFSGIPTGTKLILYNDAPAPAPGGDSRYDYYTGDPDETLIGGAPSTFAGYGPNTRTIMQIQINSSIPGAGFSLANLNVQLPAAYAQVQDKPIVPESAYNTAFNATFTNHYVDLDDTSITFTPADQSSPAEIDLQPKAVIGDFEMYYGRLTALLGTEIRRTSSNIESRVPAGYIDPPTEIFNNSVATIPIGSMGDGTQIWRITNNDVDLHPVHWHMFNLQVINRVSWDGTVLPPDPTEFGWRETINVEPLTDTIVAMRPITPNIPWELPNSVRPLDVTQSLGATDRFTNLDPTGGQAPVTNHFVNFGWEYVWHCHILGHEENDFMHAMSIAVPPRLPPTNLTALWIGPNSSPRVSLAWRDNSVSETNWTIQRAIDQSGPWTDLSIIGSSTGPLTGGSGNYNDPTVQQNTTYYYRVLATNIVGDFTLYNWTSGYPYMIVNSTPSSEVTPSLTAGTSIGVFRPSTHLYYRDFNGNGLWDGAVVDRVTSFGITGDLPASGDWNADGRTEIGVFRPSTHLYYRDFNGNGLWDGAVIDRVTSFGITGDLPASGDWNADGRTEIGVFRPSTHLYYRDFNGNGLWDGPVIDRVTSFGITGDLPASGDWNADGRTEIGVFRPSTHLYYRDFNGNGLWDGPVIDRVTSFGITGDLPASGDWNADGRTEIGVFRPSTHLYYRDFNGNGLWDGPVIDRVTSFGINEDIPVSGKWT